LSRGGGEREVQGRKGPEEETYLTINPGSYGREGWDTYRRKS